ncbi:DoxX family protein [Porphyromonas sp. COT-052 OH4946]|uniref:BT_3928 family protein n=1 Tax=Porphyromonas sp. COT-052 OH4946 TaxID=1515618 RepID=UPI00051D67C9|nr:BT_3928 family protein [Porphyromonas sp. COT-052 OH4946]KGL55287.1 DoxX family protein [Porphyromonas sp. COT-052 OH4946]
MKRFLAELSRIILGLTFIVSGLLKAIDPQGGAIKIGEYFTVFSWPKSEGLSLTLSILLCCSEFILGVFLLMGIYRRMAARFIFIFMAVMTPLTLYLAIFNPVADCGCFGEAFLLTNWHTFLKNVVLFVAAAFLLKKPRRIQTLYSANGRWLPAILAVAGIVIFTIANQIHLPMVDFRPFKVGKSLRELTQVPAGAPEDEYEYVFVYEKNGKRQDFDMNHLPDDSWTYVDRHEKLIKKGYTPPVTDFLLLRGGEDVTSEIVNKKGITLLLLSPNWEKASDDKMDNIAEMYDYARAHGWDFYGVSASGSDDISTWRYNTGADYPMLFLDAVTVKTITRGNPSLVILQDGIIKGKISDANFPGVGQAQAFFDRYIGEELYQPSYWGRLSVLVLWVALLLFGIVRKIVLNIGPRRNETEKQ